MKKRIKNFLFAGRYSWKIDTAVKYSLFHALLQYHGLHLFKKNRLRSPLLMQLQTVSGCNAECKLCPSRRQKSNKMNDEVFAAVLKSIESSGLKYIYITLQNEPTLDDTLCAKINAVKTTKPGVITEIITNGSLLNDRLMEELVNSKLDICTISIDTVDAGLFKSLRGLDLFHILAKVDKLKNHPQRKFSLFIRCTRSTINNHAIGGLKKYFRGKHIPVVVWPANDRNNDIDGQYIPHSRYYYFFKLLKIPCTIPFCIINIAWDGRLILCCNDWSANRWGSISPSVKTWIDDLAGIRGQLIAHRCDYCKNCSIYKNLNSR